MVEDSSGRNDKYFDVMDKRRSFIYVVVVYYFGCRTRPILHAKCVRLPWTMPSPIVDRLAYISHFTLVFGSFSYLAMHWPDLSSGLLFFFSSRRRHTRYWRDWSSDVCSSD